MPSLQSKSNTLVVTKQNFKTNFRIEVNLSFPEMMATQPPRMDYKFLKNVERLVNSTKNGFLPHTNLCHKLNKLTLTLNLPNTVIPCRSSFVSERLVVLETQNETPSYFFLTTHRSSQRLKTARCAGCCRRGRRRRRRCTATTTRRRRRRRSRTRCRRRGSSRATPRPATCRPPGPTASSRSVQPFSAFLSADPWTP